MRCKSTATLIMLISISLISQLSFAIDSDVQKQHWLLGVVFKLERMSDEAAQQVMNADRRIEKTDNAIRQAESAIQLSLEEKDSEAESIARQALAVARDAKAKALALKEKAELRKRRSDESSARVRNLAAQLAGVDSNIKSVVTNATGEISFYSHKTNRWDSVEKGSAVYLEPGDGFGTGSNSSAKVYFLEGRGAVSMGPNSSFILDEEKKLNEEVLRLMSGDFHFFSEEEMEKRRYKRYKIKSDFISVSPRGTEFVVTEGSEKGAQITVISGAVELTDNQGKMISVNSGFKIDVSPKGKVSVPYQIDVKSLNRWWE